MHREAENRLLLRKESLGQHLIPVKNYTGQHVKLLVQVKMNSIIKLNFFSVQHLLQFYYYKAMEDIGVT